MRTDLELALEIRDDVEQNVGGDMVELLNECKHIRIVHVAVRVPPGLEKPSEKLQRGAGQCIGNGIKAGARLMLRSIRFYSYDHSKQL